MARAICCDRHRQQPRARVPEPARGRRRFTGHAGQFRRVTADVVFGQNGSFTAAACGGGVGSGIAPGSSVFCQPDGVALDGAGDIFIADASNSRVLWYGFRIRNRRWPVVLGQFDLVDNGIDNPTAAALQGPDGVAIDSSGGNDRLYVADSGNSRVSDGRRRDVPRRRRR